MIYSLKYVVYNVLMQDEALSTSPFQVLLNHAVNGFRKMNLHGLLDQQTIKTKRIPLDPHTNIANLPEDFIDYYKVGVNHCGRIINFSYNPNISGLGGDIPLCDCNEETFISSCNCSESEYGNRWTYRFVDGSVDRYALGLYGVSEAVYHNGFVLDIPNKIMRFSSCVRNVSEVILEYKSTGIGSMGDAIIPEGAIPALMEFVKWQRYLSRQNLKMAKEHEAQFANEALALNTRNCALTEKDWYELIRSSVYQGVKG